MPVVDTVLTRYDADASGLISESRQAAAAVEDFGRKSAGAGKSGGEGFESFEHKIKSFKREQVQEGRLVGFYMRELLSFTNMSRESTSMLSTLAMGTLAAATGAGLMAVAFEGVRLVLETLGSAWERNHTLIAQQIAAYETVDQYRVAAAKRVEDANRQAITGTKEYEAEVEKAAVARAKLEEERGKVVKEGIPWYLDFKAFGDNSAQKAYFLQLDVIDTKIKELNTNAQKTANALRSIAAGQAIGEAEAEGEKTADARIKAAAAKAEQVGRERVLARLGERDRIKKAMEYEIVDATLFADEYPKLLAAAKDKAYRANLELDQKLFATQSTNLQRYFDAQEKVDVAEGLRRYDRWRVFSRLEATGGDLARAEELSKLDQWYEEQKKLYEGSAWTLLALEQQYQAKRRAHIASASEASRVGAALLLTNGDLARAQELVALDNWYAQEQEKFREQKDVLLALERDYQAKRKALLEKGSWEARLADFGWSQLQGAAQGIGQALGQIANHAGAYDRAMHAANQRTLADAQARLRAAQAEVEAAQKDIATHGRTAASVQRLTTAQENYAAAQRDVSKAQIALGDDSGAAFAKWTQALLSNLAAQAAVEAIMETAKGFAALADPFLAWSAPGHFTAAAIFGSVAGVAAGAAYAIGEGRGMTNEEAASAEGAYSASGPGISGGGEYGSSGGSAGTPGGGASAPGGGGPSREITVLVVPDSLETRAETARRAARWYEEAKRLDMIRRQS